jgi:hypothetical protein
MGPGRAGAYTYDWIENLLGLNVHSADRIVPEWQHLEVGQVLRSEEGRAENAGGDPRAGPGSLEPLGGG